jgi:hypothetical protein
MTTLSRSCSTALSTVTSHRHPSSSPSKRGKRSASTPSSSSTPFPLEPTANKAGQLTSLCHHLPLAAPLSPTAVRVPPGQPPLQEEPHTSVVRLQPDLHRRRPTIRAVVINFSAIVYLTAGLTSPMSHSPPYALIRIPDSTFPAPLPPVDRICRRATAWWKGDWSSLLRPQAKRPKWAGPLLASWADLLWMEPTPTLPLFNYPLVYSNSIQNLV